jgi:hypothetical protein
MSRIVFLLEERSMKTLLDGLLPRLFGDLRFLCVPHEGRTHLEKSIPRKLRAWREPGVRFCVVRDNDGGDCAALKASLHELCRSGGRSDSLVRIACQELEAWYFGDPGAVAAAFDHDGFPRNAAKAGYRDPDAIAKPSRELARLVPAFQKISGARRMAQHLQRDNASRSYQVFLAGVDRLASEVLAAEGDE